MREQVLELLESLRHQSRLLEDNWRYARTEMEGEWAGGRQEAVDEIIRKLELMLEPGGEE